MSRSRIWMSMLAFFVSLFCSAIVAPAMASGCVKKPELLIAVCNDGNCRAGFVVDWAFAKEGICQGRPVIVDPANSHALSSALLRRLGSWQLEDGIYSVKSSYSCARIEPGVRCVKREDMEMLGRDTSAAALEAIEADWHLREADGFEADRSYEFRVSLRLIAGTILLVSLPWLLPAAWARFSRNRIMASLGASALLVGVNFAFGNWGSPLTLGCLLALIWLPGLLKGGKPWGPRRATGHMLAILPQLFFAQLHYVTATNAYVDFLPRYHSEPLEPLFLLATVILLVAAAASGIYFAKALVRGSKRLQPAATG